MNQELYKKINQTGFTLVELMLSMTVFLVATAAVFGILKIATLQKKTASNRTDQLQSARLALEYMRRDTLNAGFGYHRTGGNAPDNIVNSMFNLPADPDTERDLMTSIISGNDINTNVLNPGVNTDFIAFISRDPTFNGGDLLNYDSATKSGNTVVLNTANNATSGCAVNNVYLIEPKSGTTQILAMATAITSNTISIATGDPLALNQSANGSGQNLNLLLSTNVEGTVNNGEGSIKKVNIISYSVTNDGTLLRRVYGNQTGTNQIETRELVYGVSDLQIRYFMEDGTTVDNPSSNHNGRTNQFKMNNVVQVQFTVTIRPNNDGTSDASTAPITIKEYVSTRNLRYEAS